RVLRAGGRAAIPLGAAALPFGLVYGVAVAESDVAGWLGVAASWIVLAGAAQLTMLSLFDGGTAWPLVVGTALLINARFVLYSTALAPAFGQFPTRWRFTLPYLLTDQAASLAIVHFDTDDDPTRRRWWFLGAALTFASGWWGGTVIGVVAADLIPADADIGFAVPAMFIALLVPTIVNVPALAAALVAGTVAVVGAGLPSGLNVIVAAVTAIAVVRVIQLGRMQ
ncbi:MAG: AzlC family ABC transporter permease, partial [Actinomycetota bacterium]